MVLCCYLTPDMEYAISILMLLEAGPKNFGNIFAPVNFTPVANEDRSFAPVRKSFVCEKCGKTFLSPRSKKEHIAAVHDCVTYPCICGKVYKYPKNIRRHRKECMVVKSVKGLG